MLAKCGCYSDRVKLLFERIGSQNAIVSVQLVISYSISKW